VLPHAEVLLPTAFSHLVLPNLLPSSLPPCPPLCPPLPPTLPSPHHRACSRLAATFFTPSGPHFVPFPVAHLAPAPRPCPHVLTVQRSCSHCVLTVQRSCSHCVLTVQQSCSHCVLTVHLPCNPSHSASIMRGQEKTVESSGLLAARGDYWRALRSTWQPAFSPAALSECLPAEHAFPSQWASALAIVPAHVTVHFLFIG